MAERVEHIQAFAGVNAQAAPHLIGEDQVATATNIDFSLERGAASVRKGSELYRSTASAAKVQRIFRFFNNASNVDGSPYYMGDQTGSIYQGSSTLTKLYTGLATANEMAFGAFGDFVFAAPDDGTAQVKHDGTSTQFIDWLKEKPSSAPTITLATVTPLAVSTAFSINAGSGTYTGGVGTASSTGTSYRVEILGDVTSTNLSTNSVEIGDYGVDTLEIQIDNPELVTRLSRDYSIGDTNFTNYYHTEMDIDFNDPALAGLELMIDDEVATATDSNIPLDEETRDQVSESIKRTIRIPVTRISQGLGYNAWSIPRPNFEFVGHYTSTSGVLGWENIGKVRIVVEADGPIVVNWKNWKVYGNKDHPLNDVNVGYQWWQTYATIDGDGNIIGESAPSSPTDRYQCQFSKAVVTNTATLTSTANDITHVLWYRQGGLMKDAYCVGSSAIGTATHTDTLNDVQALMRQRQMPRNMYSRGTLPFNVTSISDPFYSRLFIAGENELIWSLPNQPDTFPKTSRTKVSHKGDNVQGLVVWNNALVIVNRDSIYELVGTEFEGRNANWILQRQGSPHGSKAKRTICRTPYGIPILDYDGIYMYQPGQGESVLLDWAMHAIQDAFGGTQAFDPVYQKGDRIPAINKSYLQNSCAAFANNKLYLAVPTGNNSLPDFVFILDFLTQKVWWYTYYANITSMYWDPIDNRMLAGTDVGQIIKLEASSTDVNDAGAQQPIVWKVQTRQWTVPSDTLLENVWLEHRGGDGNNILSVTYDYGISTSPIGTYTGTGKNWNIPPLSGTFAKALQFTIIGTQAGTNTSTVAHQALYQLGWEGIQHPKRIQYWRTDHEVAGAPTEKQWNVHVADLEILNGTSTATTTVLGTVYVDEAVVMTNTYTGVGSTSGRQVSYNAFPPETYGDLAYTVYRVTGTAPPVDQVFKHWQTNYHTNPEPARVNFFKSDVHSLDENICDAFDTDLNPNGTVTAISYVDNTALSTATITGTKRQSYTFALPNETYGRTIYVTMTGTAFKPYNVWFHLRPEPDRWSNFVSDREIGEEAIFDVAYFDINPLTSTNTVTAVAYVDGVAVATHTITGGTLRRVEQKTLPNETYGKVSWVNYTCATGQKAKHFATWFTKRPEPPRVANYVTDREDGEQSIFDAVDCIINPLGTTSLVAYVDNVAVGTYTATGTQRQSYTFALPNNTFGRTGYVVYSPASLFKHYKTWFHRRPEPDVWSNHVSDKQAGDEQWLHTLESVMDCLGGTVYATAMVDGIAVWTYTMTGSGQRSYVHTLPATMYGRAMYTIYNGSGTTKFKYYGENWEGTPEPDRVTIAETPVHPFPSNQYLRTWLVDMNPLGTATGVIYVDNTILTTATFTGTYRQTFRVGLDVTSTLNIQKGATLRAMYTGASLKHYNTEFDTEAKPFGKQTWAISYKKMGGASQIDMARFWALEAEVPNDGTATLTSVWDVDGRAFHTNTITLTGREWLDRIPFPPDGRGYLFQQRLYSNVPIEIYKSTLDVMQVGVKGLVRRSVSGLAQ
jgi:hypothetical protein